MLIRIYLWLGFILLFTQIAIQGVNAQGLSAILLQPEMDGLVIGRQVQYMVDATGNLTLTDIQERSRTGALRWQQIKNDDPGFGFSQKAYWFRLLLENPQDISINWLLEIQYPLLDRIDLYFPDCSQQQPLYRQRTSGDLFPFFQRDLPYRNFLFRGFTEKKCRQFLYIRVHTNSSLNVPMRLWSYPEFEKNSHVEHILLGVYYGIILVMMIYNLFLFFVIPNSGYLYYVLWIFGYGGYQIGLNGYSFQFFWPNSIWWANINVPFFMGFGLVFLVQFGRKFLNTRHTMPSLDPWLRILWKSGLVVMAGVFFLPYYLVIQSATLLVLVAVITLLATGIIAISQGYRPARLYMVSWTMLFAGIVVFALKTFGILPNHFWTNWSQQIGSIMEVILLSLALADRINVIKKEREEAQQQAIVNLSKSMEQQKLYLAIQKELEIAQRIQDSNLPKEPPASAYFEMACLYRPMASVGGDFYDFHQKSEKEVGILVADVSGHGVPAALISSMIKIAFRSQLAYMGEPVRLMTELSRLLDNRKNDHFITAQYCYLCMEHKRIKLVNAGHLPLLVYRPSQDHIFELRPRGRLIGLLPQQDFEELEFTLERGDRVIFLTDGIWEARNSEGRLLESDGFYRMVRSYRQLDARSFNQAVFHELQTAYQKNGEFEDDLTLVTLDILL